MTFVIVLTIAIALTAMGYAIDRWAPPIIRGIWNGMTVMLVLFVLITDPSSWKVFAGFLGAWALITYVIIPGLDRLSERAVRRSVAIVAKENDLTIPQVYAVLRRRTLEKRGVTPRSVRHVLWLSDVERRHTCGTS